MKKEFFSSEEIIQMLHEVFFGSVKSIIHIDEQYDTSPEHTVSAINGVQDFISDVERRLTADADGD